MMDWKKIAEVVEYEDVSKEAVEKDILVKATTCIILGGFAFILTIFNILKGYNLMALITGVISGVLVFAGILCKVFKKRKLVSWVIVAVTGITYTYFAVSGANEGFAILWITCIPLLGQLLVGIKGGFALSLYFQILLIVMFYSPLREVFSAHYSEIFMNRYPILYMSNLVVATWMYYQRIASHMLSEQAGRTDAITGVDNRLGFNNKLSGLLSKGPVEKLWVHVFDINRLKYVNDKCGHGAGDEMITAAAAIIAKSYPESQIFARVGGDEFYMVHIGDQVDFEERRKAFYSDVDAWKGRLAPFLSISCGYACGEDITMENINHLISEADKDMYEQKSAYYRNSGIERRRS